MRSFVLRVLEDDIHEQARYLIFAWYHIYISLMRHTRNLQVRLCKQDSCHSVTSQERSCVLRSQHHDNRATMTAKENFSLLHSY